MSDFDRMLRAFGMTGGASRQSEDYIDEMDTSSDLLGDSHSSLPRPNQASGELPYECWTRPAYPDHARRRAA